MMGHRKRLVGGEEFDAFTPFRRLLHWRPGERRAAKQSFQRRLRRLGREALAKCPGSDTL